jgi:hypothetical protein
MQSLNLDFTTSKMIVSDILTNMNLFPALPTIHDFQDRDIHLERRPLADSLLPFIFQVSNSGFFAKLSIVPVSDLKDER